MDMPLEELGLSRIDQVGFVVDDVDAAAAAWRPILGTLTVYDATLEDANYRGHTCTCTLKIGVGQIGDTEVEFIEVVEGDSVHREFLETWHQGAHHIRFPVEDVDATLEACRPHGIEAVFGKDFGHGIKFVYAQMPGQVLLLEFIQGLA